MSRLQCRGIFFPVESKALMGRVNLPQLTDRLRNTGTLSVCPHSPALVQRGGRVVQWVPASFVVCVPMP